MDKETRDTNLEENSLDKKISNITVRLGQDSSRRDFLSWLTKGIIAAVGGTVAAALPADRRVAEANGFPVSNCSSWLWCGMNGRPCASCGGSNTSCPSAGCSTAGNPWVACCNGPSGCQRIVYYDCCATGGTCPSVSCSASCQRKDLAGWWCNGGNSVSSP